MKTTKNMNHFPVIPLSFFMLISFVTLNSVSCKKKKSEGELITTVIVDLKKNGLPYGTYTWKDADGPGGASPLNPDTIFIDSNSTYLASLTLKNESNGRQDNITEEIRNEGSQHFFCFNSDEGILKVTATDSDGKYPLGLESEWVVKKPGTTKLRIRLKHQPGSKDGTCTPGETDIDVEFPVIVK